jgi:hypothetical protein
VRDLQKKLEEEMLVVHRPPQSPEHHARLAVLPGTESLPADIDALLQRLNAANADQRSRLLGAIQTRFGNDFAGRVVDAFRRQAPDRREPSGGGTQGGDEP